MAEKAPMRQIGRFHDVGQADAVETLFAKQRTRRIDDAFAVLRGLLPAHSHTAPQLCGLGRRSLTIYMTIDMNTQAIDDDRHPKASSHRDKVACPPHWPSHWPAATCTTAGS